MSEIRENRITGESVIIASERAQRGGDLVSAVQAVPIVANRPFCPRTEALMQSRSHRERRCALCQRATTHLTRHHLIPRIVHRRPRTRRNFTRDQRLSVVLLCRACHKQIHSLFTEAELARTYCSIEALAAHPQVARFVGWVARQPPTVDVPVRRRR
jgi:hypothetical protein